VVEADHHLPALLASERNPSAAEGFSAKPEGNSSVTSYGKLQIECPPLHQEESMESSKPDTSMTNDVLHIPAESKLSAEAIAKAVAHHNKHRGGGQEKNPATKPNSGKKQGGSKSK
jgi:hypothetical protein